MKKNTNENYFALMRSTGCGIMSENMETGADSIVAIACSTGGPKALQSVIPLLHANLNAPVVIVQHMPEGFTRSLADRLNELSELNVTEAGEGEVLECGRVYVAKGGLHMEIHMNSLNQPVIRYQGKPLREGVRPCANYMYESLAESCYARIICVVLTGMGSDGRDGIALLKSKKKIQVIAQNEDTSVVYGMPKCIVEAGLADEVVPLTRIADRIEKLAGLRK